MLGYIMWSLYVLAVISPVALYLWAVVPRKVDKESFRNYIRSYFRQG